MVELSRVEQSAPYGALDIRADQEVAQFGSVYCMPRLVITSSYY
jgi:hypothetical protein